MRIETEIRNLFPAELWHLWKEIGRIGDSLQEIRIRVGQPVLLEAGEWEYVIGLDDSLKLIAKSDGDSIQNWRDGCYIMTLETIRRLFSYLCKNSIYAYTEELKRGYLTVVGGHRIGIAGEMAQLQEGIFALRHVYYMNIRIAREVVGAADAILPYLYQKGDLQSTLLISPPGYGKTTVLRDAIRQIANGNHWGVGHKVGVVDERMELAGCEDGTRTCDLGMRTDVLSGCLKKRGIMMLLRSMGPEVIAVDEIGGGDDVEALKEAAHCGCSLLATMHGNDRYDARMKQKMSPFWKDFLFSRYIYLGKQTDPSCKNMVLNECGEVMTCF